MKEFFTNNLEQLIDSLIIPNISPNAFTKDTLIDDNETFIDYNFRNAEIGTRKASAVELLRTICRYYKNFEIIIEKKFEAFLKSDKSPKGVMIILNLLI